MQPRFQYAVHPRVFPTMAPGHKGHDCLGSGTCPGSSLCAFIVISWNINSVRLCPDPLDWRNITSFSRCAWD